MATMSDVAKRAGVALSTVSHALSGKRPISEETKQRIFRAMAELDYQSPNALARSLATKHSSIVALHLPPPKDGLIEAHYMFVASTAEAIRKMGYNLLLWTAPANDLSILQMLQQGFVEGLILMEVALQDIRVEALRERDYPFSLIGRCENNDGLNLVDFDFEDAIEQAVLHLESLGHRHIGLLGHSPLSVETGYGPAVRSIRSFQQVIQQRNLNGIVRNCDMTPQGGYEVTRNLLAECPSVSALILFYDTNLTGLVQAVTEAGLTIPGDISVIGVIAPRFAFLPNLPVTTLDFPMSDMGRIGAELLVKQLREEPDEPQQYVLRAELVVRQSTGPCRERISPTPGVERRRKNKADNQV